eukprot:4471778-Amphidinium_carterae.2
MEEEQEALPPAQSCPGRPDQETGGGALDVEEPPELTPAELFNSAKPAAAAALALLQAAAPPPKMEDSESSFHDPRDDVPTEPGSPATVLAESAFQPSIRDELLQRAAAAVAAERTRAETQRAFEDDVDYGEKEDSDL